MSRDEAISVGCPSLRRDTPGLEVDAWPDEPREAHLEDACSPTELTLEQRGNLTRRGLRYLFSDAFVVSVPKSGRTWVRTFLRHYLAQLSGEPFRLKGRLGRTVPHIEFCHDHWEHLQARGADRLLGKYLIPAIIRRRKPIVLLTRNLDDLMVSLHFHFMHRGFACGATFGGSVKELINHPDLGVERCVDLQNAWLREWQYTTPTFIWRYEDCIIDPEITFSKLLHFFNLPVIGEVLSASIEFSSFESMHRMEAEGTHWGSSILRPGNPENPQSFKTRCGKVGGGTEFLDDTDMASISRAQSRLLSADLESGVLKPGSVPGTDGGS